ncbi:MAG: gliding motility-associated C-terminal domain-containing protein [Bacteroidetes bacterium]|nr:gliding motility-associated C-terminal domain-containing protein [Bacteroidota bacterium]
MNRICITLISICLLSFGLRGQSVGGTTTGSTSYCSTSNAGFIGLSGQIGTVLSWEESINGGTTWTTTGNTATNQSYFNLPQSTCYRAIVQDGVNPPDTSTISCIYVFSQTVGGTTSGASTFCSTSATGTITLSGNTGNVLNWLSSTDGGINWTTITNASNTHNFIGLTQNTTFAAIVQNSPACLVDTSTVSLITLQTPSIAGTLSLLGNDTVCYGFNNDTLQLTGQTGNILNWVASPDNGATWINIANTNSILLPIGITQTLLFSVIVQSGACPADTATGITINVLPPPAPVDAGTDATIAAGQTIQLNGSGTGTPFWIPVASLNNPAIFNPIASPQTTTNYVFTITDSNGCLNADTVLVTVTQTEFTGTVSSYFSPNGDGINDNWYIEDILSFPKNEVHVYNIYGQEVYTKKGYANDWKGTFNGADLPDGTYYYVLTIESEKIINKGSVDILRKK